MLKLLFAAAVLVIPAAARAQTVTIKRGETMTLILGDDDRPTVATAAATTANPYETAATAEFQRGDYDAAMGPNSLPMTADSRAGVLAPVPPRGKVVLRFVRSPGKDDAMLSIQNGLGRAFAYRASMTIAGKRQATDVCVVPPGKTGNEYWPHRIDALDLSSIRMIPWSEGDRVICE